MVRAHEVRVQGWQPAQLLAGLLGVLFLAYGIVGLVKSGFGDFTGHGVTLWRFSANPLNNVVHVVTGVVGLSLTFGSGRARTFGWLLFLGYGVLFVWGLMLAGTISVNPVSGLGNPLNLAGPDNWLHLGIAVVGLLTAVLPARHGVLPVGEADAEEPETETPRRRRRRHGLAH
ncbi:DUF4383 domain-containing protein [Amycolatopsis benzoatilytica]|uniref:DUF4383 domain-containing protein n=1 Tax=Amycolatopsis benzoatilytica TaxID=346045 RepID=UPI0003661723|nr:DUF4383 domain-containing protein [Amycolatopsis benzoatilytica]